MDEKSKIIIQRFIDGEKDLFNKLKEIDVDNDNDIYANYLRALFNDNMDESFRFKRLIRNEISNKYKPNFKQKSKTKSKGDL